MRIGINLLSFKEITGLEVYTQNLLENIGITNKENDFFLFTNQIDLSWLHFNFLNFHYIKTPVDPRRRIRWSFWEQCIFPFYLKKYKIDILFNPTIFNPLFCFCKKITVIHDCGYLYNKKFSFKIFYLNFVTWSATKSFKIIVDSSFSKKELLNFYKLSEQKIEIIYGGAPKMIYQKKGELDFLRRMKIKNHYFFYIGLITPSKNIKNLLKAFKIISKKYQNIGLVMAGKDRPKLLNIEKLIEELDLKEKVILTGYINNEEKYFLYKNSIALCFPSFHEGFGLPVLEAQSLGVPVLTSNVTSLPEIAGNGALYVNPYNVEEIAQGMKKIAFDEKLREDLIKKGFENIKRFSWEESAKKILKIFHESSSN